MNLFVYKKDIVPKENHFYLHFGHHLKFINGPVKTHFLHVVLMNQLVSGVVTAIKAYGSIVIY